MAIDRSNNSCYDFDDPRAHQGRNSTRQRHEGWRSRRYPIVTSRTVALPSSQLPQRTAPMRQAKVGAGCQTFKMRFPGGVLLVEDLDARTRRRHSRSHMRRRSRTPTSFRAQHFGQCSPIQFEARESRLRDGSVSSIRLSKARLAKIRHPPNSGWFVAPLCSDVTFAPLRWRNSSRRLPPPGRSLRRLAALGRIARGESPTASASRRQQPDPLAVGCRHLRHA